MTEALPIACSLTGSELRERYRDLARFGAENLIARSSDGRGEELRFRRSPENEQSLRSIVAAEVACCPFLDFDLTIDDGELVLQITASDDGRPVAAELAATFGQAQSA